MSQAFEALKSREDSLLLHTYTRYPVSIVRGKGSRVWDVDGKEYIDLLAGIAVTSVGHCNEEIAEVMSEQARKLVHVSNLFYQEEQLEYAQKLLPTAKLDRVFFCNSGAEANEAGFKLARRWQRKINERDAYEIISLENCFHGRTFSALAATGKYFDGFEPLPAGFGRVPVNDLPALEQAINPKTAAVIMEMIQGEGGVMPLDVEYALAVSKLCRERDVLLIIDEVQTGVARTGKFWAFQNFDIQPDIVTSAKALANGLPLGATMCTERVAPGFDYGSHATTFGGGALVTKVGSKVIEIIKRDNLEINAAYLGAKIKAAARDLAEKHPGKITDVRGMGLMVGIQLGLPAEQCKQVWLKLIERGYILNLAQGTTLRLLPALNIPKNDLLSFADCLDGVLAEI